ncbi:hypothetical protein [Pandoraea oxalativorans]|uniref:hypothetical protein n=1 Tax=Pandoraea oxalativorans TaxID=573737 RepID=UPI0012F4ED99|nr:hypothetical protein [Pandoraea oxalativorans]
MISDFQYRIAGINPATGLAEIGGKFHEGMWQADLYTNDVAERDNPTSIKQVEAEVEKQSKHSMCTVDRVVDAPVNGG